MKECIVCRKAGSAYKCPKCNGPYCSVKCCQEHKPCHFDPENKRKAGVAFTQVEEIDSLLREEQKAFLTESPWIHEMLKSKRLRQDINTVDSSVDRQKTLKQFRENNPEFDAFVRKLVDELRNCKKEI